MAAPSSSREAQIPYYEGIFPSQSVRTIHRADDLNLNDQQKIRLGTCAWKHKEWRGSFYPPELPDEQWLEHYARYLPAVEIDSTFAGAPDEATVLRWTAVTPASFRFTCKLPRSITHNCGLQDCTREFTAFLRAME